MPKKNNSSYIVVASITILSAVSLLIAFLFYSYKFGMDEVKYANIFEKSFDFIKKNKIKYYVNRPDCKILMIENSLFIQAKNNNRCNIGEEYYYTTNVEYNVIEKFPELKTEQDNFRKMFNQISQFDDSSKGKFLEIEEYYKNKNVHNELLGFKILYSTKNEIELANFRIDRGLFNVYILSYAPKANRYELLYNKEDKRQDSFTHDMFKAPNWYQEIPDYI